METSNWKDIIQNTNKNTDNNSKREREGFVNLHRVSSQSSPVRVQAVREAVFLIEHWVRFVTLLEKCGLLAKSEEASFSSLAHSCTIFPCYLGMEINQCKDPIKDCRVGQLTISSLTIVVASFVTPHCVRTIFDIKQIMNSFKLKCHFHRVYLLIEDNLWTWTWFVKPALDIEDSLVYEEIWASNYKTGVRGCPYIT